MKKFLCMAITVMMLLTLAILPALAESSPLMYKVTDKDGHSIYVLGTLHMADKDTLPIRGLDEILGNVDRVIFELSAEDMEKVVHAGELAGADAAQLAGSIENDVPVFVLDNGLSEETLNLLAGFFSRAFQQEMEADNLRMISVPVLYQMLQAQLSAMSGYDSSKSVDFAVYEKAKELGKKIEGAETIAEQVKAVNAEGVNQVASEKQINLVPTLAVSYVGFKQGWPTYDRCHPGAGNAMRNAHDAGVLVGFGTDDFQKDFGKMPAVEWVARSEFGVSNLDLLKQATINSAKICKCDKKYGTIKVGKVADFAIFDGDPLTDLMVFNAPAAFVFKNGQVVAQNGVVRTVVSKGWPTEPATPPAIRKEGAHGGYRYHQGAGGDQVPHARVP